MIYHYSCRWLMDTVSLSSEKHLLPCFTDDQTEVQKSAVILPRSTGVGRNKPSSVSKSGLCPLCPQLPWLESLFFSHKIKPADEHFYWDPHISETEDWKDWFPHGEHLYGQVTSDPPHSQLKWTREAGAASNGSSSCSRDHGSCPSSCQVSSLKCTAYSQPHTVTISPSPFLSPILSIWTLQGEKSGYNL